MWQCQTRVCQLKPVLFILGSDCCCESCSRVVKFATRIHTVRVHCRGYRFQNSKIGFLKDEFQTMNKTMCLCIKTRLTFLEFHCVLLLNGLEIIYICWFIFIARQSFVWWKHDPRTNWVVQNVFFHMRLETRPKLRCWWKIDRFFRAFLAVFFQSKSYTFWFPETFRDPLHRLAANKMIVCSRFQSRVSVILPAVVFFFNFVFSSYSEIVCIFLFGLTFCLWQNMTFRKNGVIVCSPLPQKGSAQTWPTGACVQSLRDGGRVREVQAFWVPQPVSK